MRLRATLEQNMILSRWKGIRLDTVFEHIDVYGEECGEW